jgi:hypothetical protein
MWLFKKKNCKTDDSSETSQDALEQAPENITPIIPQGNADCDHVWEYLTETDYGEIDYSSYGGGVEPFFISLYRCHLCGALHKEYRGDICGNPDMFLEITDEDYAIASRYQ